jgi:hypothetical protein
VVVGDTQNKGNKTPSDKKKHFFTSLCVSKLKKVNKEGKKGRSEEEKKSIKVHLGNKPFHIRLSCSTPQL